MDLINEAKKLADANGDGSLSFDDLASLQEKFPDQSALIEKVQQAADANGDSKVDLSDLGSLGNLDLGSITDAIGSFFGKK